MNGCGMDMGFSLVYDLGRVLFRDNFRCIGKGCPSSDHDNYRSTIRCHGSEGGDGVPCFKGGDGVYRLRTGTGKSFGLGEVCPTCKGKGEWPNQESEPRKGFKHSDGGYALRQRWL